ncbi:hypothetical protein [Nostoc sp. WHI]|uniref:hypothetical protein n=1 Tax=Nostoc sp. WHI TaxID=2650611 RepID=UPI0018C80397|nr:hypothetical protein [Nostoc sp. WHI]
MSDRLSPLWRTIISLKKLELEEIWNFQAAIIDYSPPSLFHIISRSLASEGATLLTA